MSKIFLKNNYLTSDIEAEIEFQPHNPTQVEMFVGFIDENKTITFDSLTFTFDLKEGDTVIKQAEYPQDGERFLSTDQEYVISELLFLKQETEYSLHVVTQDGEIKFEKTINFTTPRQEAPFPSWVWDEEKWNPPIPRPDDGLYRWDEPTLSWGDVVPTKP